MTVKGRTLVLGLFAVLAAFLGFLFWIGATGGGTSNLEPSTRPSEAAAAGQTTTPGASSALPFDAAIRKALADRAVRDELRKRILAGWAASGDEETAAAARAGRFQPRPNDAGTGIDPKYIQQVVREDFFPMAKQCYEELLARKPDAGGRVEMEFTIVADDKLGGIVEDAGLGEGGTLTDDKMGTCIRESLTTLAFPPPAGDGGIVTVVYPIVFAPDGPDE